MNARRHDGSRVEHQVFGLAAVIYLGCYSPPTTQERLEQSIVLTARDDSADFGAIRSFFARPEIRVLDESATDRAQAVLPSDLAAPLLEATEENLVAGGYVPASSRRDADIAIELIYLRTVLTDYYCYSWPDWSYWGYPGYYAYYAPDSCSATAWRSGMLVTSAVDLTSAPATAPDASVRGEGLRGVWYSGVYGAELDSEQPNVDRAIAGINQAFAQSPYFTRTPGE